MVLIAVHLHAALYLLDDAVDADIQIPFLAHALEEFPVVTLAVSHQGRQDIDALAGVVGLYHADDLLLGVFHHLLTRHITVGGACAGKEQSQEVVHLGDRSYG